MSKTLKLRVVIPKINMDHPKTPNEFFIFWSLEPPAELFRKPRLSPDPYRLIPIRSEFGAGETVGGCRASCVAVNGGEGCGAWGEWEIFPPFNNP